MIYSGPVPGEVEPEALIQRVCPGSWADILCMEAKKISGRKGTEILERLLKHLWMERALLRLAGRKGHPG